MANSATTEVFNQRATAAGYLNAVDAVVTNAITRAMGFPGASQANVAYNLTAVEPAVPEVENSTITFDAQLDAIIAKLTGELEDYFNKYYPLAADAFDEATNWVINQITMGGTGLNPSVEAQIWQRDRDRVIAEGARVEAQTLGEFSGRGFSLPPGAMAARLASIKTAQLESLQASSRDAAIKQAELTLENLRFAIESASKSRIAAMQAASDYIRALMSGTDTAARVASINSDVKARMMAATSDLYRARLARDELAMKIPLSNQDALLKVQNMNIDGYGRGAATAASASSTQAEAFARAASAALSAISAIVSSAENSFA